MCLCECVSERGEKRGNLSVFVALLRQADQDSEPTCKNIAVHTLVGELKCGTRETYTHTHNDGRILSPLVPEPSLIRLQ